MLGESSSLPGKGSYVLILTLFGPNKYSVPSAISVTHITGFTSKKASDAAGDAWLGSLKTVVDNIENFTAVYASVKQ